MARYVTQAVHVPRAPFGSVTLRAGEQVPEWAEALVGDHVTTDTAPAPVKPTPAPAPVSPEPEPSAGPDATWTNPQIRDYATEHGISLGEATTKADMLAAIAGN